MMTNEKQFREAVVAEAMTWLATPYHHQANLKGIGVDCAMILVEVFSKVGAVEWFDPRPYPVDWHLHRDAERYLDQLLPLATAVEGEPKPGDIVLTKFGRTFSHSAIVTAWPTVIHAYAKDRCVTLADATKMPFAGREIKAFTLWSDA